MLVSHLINFMSMCVKAPICTAHVIFYQIVIIVSVQMLTIDVRINGSQLVGSSLHENRERKDDTKQTKDKQ